MAERTCAIPGCLKMPRRRSADWCEMHYARWYRHGDPLLASDPNRQPKPSEPCSRDGCIRAVTYNKLCRIHVRSYPPCGAPDCDLLAIGGYGYCDKHYQRYRTHGDPTVVVRLSGADNSEWVGDAVGYAGVHHRVRTIRGSARDHQCSHCQVERARHWAYDRSDADERSSPRGPYSVDPMHYLPLCVPCHKNFDLGERRRRASTS